MRRTTLPLAFGLLALALTLAIGTAGAQDTPDEVAVDVGCYLAAEERTLLSEENREELCLGATSTAPVSCFELGDERTILGDDQLIRLCRCARTQRPVQCYQRGEDEPTLEEEQLVNSCRPIHVHRLLPSCLPLEVL